MTQTSDSQGRREVQKLLEQEEKKKRDYFQEKEDKAVSEFRRRKTERTKGRKVSSFNKLKDPKIIRWVIGVVAVLAVVIPVVTLMWYSNNQKESETNPWKNGQLAKSKEQAASSSDNQSSQVDTSSLSDKQLEDWVFSTYAKEQGSTGENYKNLGWNVYSWTDDDNLVYAQLYDTYGNEVLLFRVDKKGQLEAYGGIDGSSDSWDVVSKTYTTD
ncbi:Uncharacterised protein [Streptococcus vestibularis]|uniref:Uncharacterized protein n=1 Tax=Streptococcus vestibularis TaxID=1343 RepID=A0A564S8K6_STRVE|nr:Uncharacterised protein [Streptococcus vestibularis]